MEERGARSRRVLIGTYNSLVDEPFLALKRPRERIPGHADYRINQKIQAVKCRGTFFIYTFIWRYRPCFLCGGRIMLRGKKIYMIVGALSDPKPAMEMAERLCDELDIGFMRKQRTFWFAMADGPGVYKPTDGSRKRRLEDMQAHAYKARLAIKKRGAEYHEKMKNYALPGHKEEGEENDNGNAHLL